MLYETSPTPDESLLMTMATVSVTAPGVTVTPILAEYSDTGLTRYFRWAVTPASLPSTGPWDVLGRAVRMPPSRPEQAIEGALRHAPRSLANRLAPPLSAPSAYFHLKER